MEKAKILIVDDEMLYIDQILDCFEDNGMNYDFVQASNAADGISLADKELPDLIISDWRMPGMTGIEMITQLKENKATRDIPVMMMTGIMTSSKNLQTAFAAGAIDFIRKPVDELELISRTRSMLMLSSYYKQILDLKNREVMSTAMSLMEKNKLNKNIIEQLQRVENVIGDTCPNARAELSKIVNQLTYNQKGDSWMQFETYFKQVHPDFFPILLEKYPKLTPAELKLCAFLRLNLSTKEIASITYQIPDSVRIARTRLRKKLELNQNENLVAFLLTI